MRPLRQFLIKHFVLDYFGNWFGWKFNAPKASRIIYPLVVISGYFTVTNTDYPNPSFFLWILYVLLALSLWFGFPLFGAGYFSIWPAQWDELDDLQKYQYGKFKTLTEAQLEEWIKISKEIEKG
jgi:hypothetical protein